MRPFPIGILARRAWIAPVAGCLLAAATPGMDAPISGPSEATMKAVRVHAFGGPDVLHLDTIAAPTPAAGEVLVRVRAAGVNPVDWKIREGYLKGMAPTPPFVLGFDVAGVVERAGPSVEGFAPGDPVFAYLSLRRGGGYAEFVAVPAKDLARAPKSIDANAAASVPLAALTAYQALFDHAGLKPGQRVLVHGGAGGVGHFAVQLAKAKGATVYATAAGEDRDFLKALGADVVIDYRNERFEEIGKDMDVVLESIGGENLERSYGVLKSGGFLVSIVGQPDQAKLAARGARGAGMLVQPDGAQLAEIASLIDAGKLKPHVSRTFPLADAGKAHEHLRTTHTQGKIVLTVP